MGLVGRHGLEPVTWLALAAIGFGAAVAVRLLERSGRLTAAPVAEPVPA